MSKILPRKTPGAYVSVVYQEQPPLSHFSESIGSRPHDSDKLNDIFLVPQYSI